MGNTAKHYAVAAIKAQLTKPTTFEKSNVQVVDCDAILMVQRKLTHVCVRMGVPLMGCALVHLASWRRLGLKDALSYPSPFQAVQGPRLGEG